MSHSLRYAPSTPTGSDMSRSPTTLADTSRVTEFEELATRAEHAPTAIAMLD